MSDNDVEVKRQFVMDLYPGPGWKARVKKMPDAQVLAIYFREKNKPAPAKKKEEENDPPPF